MATDRGGARGYDPRLFGGREPDPAWELWPAGYVVEFGIAGPVLGSHGDDPSLAPASSDAPAPSPSGGADDRPAAGTPAPSEPWIFDEVVDLGSADFLVALGVNTPVEVRVDTVRLGVVDGTGSVRPVAVVRLPTLWESSHFLVIAPEDAARSGQPGPWAPGLYRLDVVTIAGEVREIRLMVGRPLG